MPRFQHEPTTIRILNSSDNRICIIQYLVSKSKSSALKVVFRCQSPSLLGLYQSSEKETESCGLVFPSSTKREFKALSRCSRAVTTKKMFKKA